MTENLMLQQTDKVYISLLGNAICFCLNLTANIVLEDNIPTY